MNLKYIFFYLADVVLCGATIGSCPWCHNWQLSVVPQLAVVRGATIGGYPWCHNWRLSMVPQLASVCAASFVANRTCTARKQNGVINLKLDKESLPSK